MKTKKKTLSVIGFCFKTKTFFIKPFAHYESYTAHSPWKANQETIRISL